MPLIRLCFVLKHCTFEVQKSPLELFAGGIFSLPFRTRFKLNRYVLRPEIKIYAVVGLLPGSCV